MHLLLLSRRWGWVQFVSNDSVEAQDGGADHLHGRSDPRTKGSVYPLPSPTVPGPGCNDERTSGGTEINIFPDSLTAALIGAGEN